MKRRILVATDGSEAADRAVDYAAGLAKREDADLLIANVVGGYGLPDGLYRTHRRSRAGLAEGDARTRLSARNADEGARARAQPPARIRSSSNCRAGEVAESIIEIAKEKSAAVIVVGKRGARTSRAASARQRLAQARRTSLRAGDRRSPKSLHPRKERLGAATSHSLPDIFAGRRAERAEPLVRSAERRRRGDAGSNVRRATRTTPATRIRLDTKRQQARYRDPGADRSPPSLQSRKWGTNFPWPGGATMPRLWPPITSAKVISVSVRKWILNTERQGATWSRSVPTTKIGARMSCSATKRPSSLNRPSARSLSRKSSRRYSLCIL